MIDVNQLRKGTTFTENGELYRVLDYKHHKPGRGKATIRVVVRNLRTGAVTNMTFNSGDRVEDIRVETVPVEYLYSDGEFLHFMDLQTFEQPQLRREIFGDDILYLKENMQLELSRYGNEIIDYILPNAVDLEVVEAEMAVAGDTANNPSKKVKTETGLEVQVPLFVNVGDVIRIKTEDNSYVTRV
ncbi:MAG: elongation factor P [Phototrophicales bacterium]|nr:MAG: elongation factor P [Phototrophicales bacterium]